MVVVAGLVALVLGHHCSTVFPTPARQAATRDHRLYKEASNKVLRLTSASFDLTKVLERNEPFADALQALLDAAANDEMIRLSVDVIPGASKILSMLLLLLLLLCWVVRGRWLVAEGDVQMRKYSSPFTIVSSASITLLHPPPQTHTRAHPRRGAG